MPRRAIIEKSLANRGALILTRDLDEACAIADRIAPEHLEISTDEPERWAAKIRHAGALFLGRHTSEALGDYCAGPNHVLPTSRTARFSSPLGVYDFQKRTSLIRVSEAGAQTLGRVAATLARGEQLAGARRQRRIPAGETMSAGRLNLSVLRDDVRAIERLPGAERHRADQARRDGEPVPAAAGPDAAARRPARPHRAQPLSAVRSAGLQGAAGARDGGARGHAADARQRLRRTDPSRDPGLRPAGRRGAGALARAS